MEPAIMEDRKAITSHQGFGTLDCRQRPFAKAPVFPPSSRQPPSTPQSQHSRGGPRRDGPRRDERTPIKSHGALENLIYQQGAIEDARQAADEPQPSSLSAPIPDLLQHAFSELQRDRDTYVVEEAMCGDAAQLLDSKKRKSARDLYARIAKQRPPALPATHPTHHQQLQQQHRTPNMLPTPPPEEDAAQLKTQKPLPEKQNFQPVQPDHQTSSPSRPPKFTDPKRLQSAQPPAWNPIAGIHKMDVNEFQPKVISPIYMIGLPLGGQIEMANCEY
ncbi:Hypothetical predicted protein [Lecanosticta acicola]|uniref:Uncharacterized protein n=1 Tax=Lecanosticta acicola TaxID=111012 RepID=A0AAI8Z4G7_9PEZI|nr:Hypothetical predicted protein [Lecanosticta acicola]